MHRRLERLDFAWRLLGTAIGFTLFGIGALILATLVFPIIAVTSWSTDTRRRRCQRMIQLSFRGFVGTLRLLGVADVRFSGEQRLTGDKPMLVLANHPTLLDVVILISRMPQADCVVKQALWRNLFMGGVVRAAGYVSNSSPQQVVDDCSQLLGGERALVLFPEGTRSVPGQPLRFQRGAARVALKSKVPIVPVTVSCDPPTLMKNTPWYRIPPRRMVFRFVVHAPVDVPELLDEPGLPEPAAVRRLTEALQELFERKIEEHERTYRETAKRAA